MVELSEFERRRQENIKKNKDLLKSLDLDTIASGFKSQPAPKPSKKRRAPTTRTKEVVEPARRSRRIAGIKTETENPEEYQRLQDELEEKERKKKELEALKRTRLFGDFSLMDLITDKQGHLKHENKVIKSEKEERGVKEESEDASEVKEDVELSERDHKVLQTLKQMGSRLSAGDFYDEIRKCPTDYDVESKRKEFDELKIYPRFDPLDIKLTHYRITSINFHPGVTDRLVMAGDTNGNVGIWAVDDSGEEPAVSILKPHGKSVSKVLTSEHAPSKIYTSSYDGSVRELDLNKLESSEVAYLHDPWESANYELGVSDINTCHRDSPQVLYMTTLSGNFYQHDTRTKFKPPTQTSLLRLHDKKIGGFSINPNCAHQIATASLDRTLRIWDLRNVSKKNGAWSDFDDQTSPHAYGSYGSRLSVSTVDWNSDNTLVCNGYDDNIALFDFSSPPITEWTKTYRPPTNAKNSSTDEDPNAIPENFVPFTKIRHNCQTGRWVSILKARWQARPQDGVQKFVIANMNRGLDIYDQKGHILAHLSESVGAVPAVATLHPSQNWVVGGSASGKIYLFDKH